MAPAGAAAELVPDHHDGEVPGRVHRHRRGRRSRPADGGVHCTIGGRAVPGRRPRGLRRRAGHDRRRRVRLRWRDAAAAGGPTGAVGVAGVVPDGRLINLPGCPLNVENLTATIVHYLTFKELPPTDGRGRPLFAYGGLIHNQCERRAHFEFGEFVLAWGDEGAQKGWCLYKMGCKGPETFANCPTVRYGEGASWTVKAGHGCIGCTMPGFWDAMTPAYRRLPPPLPFMPTRDRRPRGPGARRRGRRAHRGPRRGDHRPQPPDARRNATPGGEGGGRRRGGRDRHARRRPAAQARRRSRPPAVARRTGGRGPAGVDRRRRGPAPTWTLPPAAPRGQGSREMTRLVIDPVTRIGGHLRIEAEVANGVVADAWSSGTMFRGLELILRGRDPRDAWLFAQRICGSCTGVHALASVRAVENALGVVDPPERPPGPQPDRRDPVRPGPRRPLLPPARARLGRRRGGAAGRPRRRPRRWPTPRAGGRSRARPTSRTRGTASSGSSRPGSWARSPTARGVTPPTGCRRRPTCSWSPTTSRPSTGSARSPGSTRSWAARTRTRRPSWWAGWP